MKFKIFLLVSALVLLFTSCSCTLSKTPTTSIVKVTETTKVTETRTKTLTTEETITVTETTTVTITTNMIPINVKTSTYGNGQIATLDMETEYLPIVVAGMVSEGSIESLKAQTIVARSYAFYKMIYESVSGSQYYILDADAVQTYNPAEWANLTPQKQDMIKQAIRDTTGLVLKYADMIICSYYVRGDSNTLHYVTLNEGKSGNDITQTTLIPFSAPPSGTPHNRGCMGLKQSKDLAKQGYTYDLILQYFYGSDIVIEKHIIYP